MGHAEPSTTVNIYGHATACLQTEAADYPQDQDILFFELISRFSRVGVPQNLDPRACLWRRIDPDLRADERGTLDHPSQPEMFSGHQGLEIQAVAQVKANPIVCQNHIHALSIQPAGNADLIGMRVANSLLK